MKLTKATIYNLKQASIRRAILTRNRNRHRKDMFNQAPPNCGHSIPILNGIYFRPERKKKKVNGFSSNGTCQLTRQGKVKRKGKNACSN